MGRGFFRQSSIIMKMTYIQFETTCNNASSNGQINKSFKKVIRGILEKIIPKANPDYENKIENVKYWLVECDTQTGIPQREISLNYQEKVILKMPYKQNYGYWTDNHLLMKDFKKLFNASEISKEIFEQSWNTIK